MASPESSVGRAPGGFLSRGGFYLSLAAPLVATAGALLAYDRWTTPFAGFRVFLVSLPLSLLALCLCSVALVRTHGGRNPGARRRARGGIALAVMLLAALGGLALPSAGRPLINDITTDLDEPPQFVHAATLPANRDRDLSYPGDFAAQQRQGYPHLAPLYLRRSPAEALARARSAIESLPFARITATDEEAGTIEATNESRTFHFVDDVVVRVRPHRRGSRVDVRSKSRDGKSDMGANARRIETILSLIR